MEPIELCKAGHPLDAANLYVSPRSGQRMCRECSRVVGRLRWKNGSVWEMRRWAERNGHTISERGSLPRAVVSAYRIAHQKPRDTMVEPVRRLFEALFNG